jgi:hypothetical protein
VSASKGPGSVTDGVAALFNQLGQFFHIFDLSFLASGATSLGAIAFACAAFHAELPRDLPSWVWITTTVLGSYVAGVACFAVGRKFRANSIWRNTLHHHLRAFMETHGLLDDPLVLGYFNKGGSDIEQNMVAFRLYSRLWAELRDDYGSSESYRALNRYWVTSAMYDGLVISFLIWSGVMLATSINLLRSHDWILSSFVAATSALFALLSRACYQEGDRNFQYQVSELVATFAAMKRKIGPVH